MRYEVANSIFLLLLHILPRIYLFYFYFFQDVVNSLQEKLNLKCVQHFNLVLHNMKSHMPGRMTLLQEHETVSEVMV